MNYHKVFLIERESEHGAVGAEEKRENLKQTLAEHRTLCVAPSPDPEIIT